MPVLSEKRKEQIRQSARTYRKKNIEVCRLRDRLHKIIYREFQRLRQIDLFD